jgi:hypothetical protein
MPLGEQADDGELDGLPLAPDHPLHVSDDILE